MIAKLRNQANPATMLALVALFVALGGVSYAAATIDGSSIANGSITNKKLKKGTITGAKIKANAIGGAKIRESTLGKVPSAATADSAAQAQNAVQAQSAASAQSAQSAATVGAGGVDAAAIQDGAVGAAKLASVTVRNSESDVADGATAQLFVSCQAGELPLSGGVDFGGQALSAVQAQDTHLVRSGPTVNGWGARVYNGSGSARLYTISVVCLAP